MLGANKKSTKNRNRDIRSLGRNSYLGRLKYKEISNTPLYPAVCCPGDPQWHDVKTKFYEVQ
jgi:hypothetical protein